jgi:hypothetical protein
VSSRSEFNNFGGGLFAPGASRSTLGEAAFHRMISLERRRTSRSRKSFLLMLVETGEQPQTEKSDANRKKLFSALSSVLRETDVTGWYKEDSVVGVLFTEIALENQRAIPSTMMNRVTGTLKSNLTPQQFRQLGISFHLLSEAREHDVFARGARAHIAV